MNSDFILSFRPNILLVWNAQSRVMILKTNDWKITLENLKVGWQSALNILATRGATLSSLNQLIDESEGSYGKIKFYYFLQKVIKRGGICHSVHTNGRSFATSIPLILEYQFAECHAEINQKFVISRFAYCHKLENNMFLECPLATAHIILYDWRSAAIIALLASPIDCKDINEQISQISLETTQKFLSLLLSLKFIVLVQEDGRSKEESDLSLEQWEFHDLVFHCRSRKGRHMYPLGGTYRFRNKIGSLPAVKPVMSDEVIDLYKPNIKNLKATESAFTNILESRKSIRQYASDPLTAQQLGEFLYRSARLKSIIQTERGDISNRPYPSGGAIYELELYTVINICENLVSGIYHYNPASHQLHKLADKTEVLERLLKDAYLASNKQCLPQVLIVITARFQRISWKYESIAYSLILKNVGVLYQTMYLVATAMEIAPCALGTGNSDLFAKAAGINYLVETSVGEFAIGSKIIG